MQQWEYAIISDCSNTQLSEMGIKGWELVTIRADAHWIFKRPRRAPVHVGRV